MRSNGYTQQGLKVKCLMRSQWVYTAGPKSQMPDAIQWVHTAGPKSQMPDAIQWVYATGPKQNKILYSYILIFL